MSRKSKLVNHVLMWAIWSSGFAIQRASAIEWEAVELPVKLTVGYAVRAVDVNQDGRQDIAIVDSKRVLWLENPSWKEHVIYSTPDAKADNVCFAPHDVDGDGLIDFALGADWQPNNTDAGGSIGWLHQQPRGKWTYHAITNEPTTHRMHWVDLKAGQKSLVVAPLKGRGSRAPGFDQTGVRFLALTPGGADQKWDSRLLLDSLHVSHNFHLCDLDRDQRTDFVCASYEGATWIRLNPQGDVAESWRIGIGQEQAPPTSGASEIRTGQLGDGRSFLATIEPWHGDKVVTYVAPKNWLDMVADKSQADSSKRLWHRTVVDDELAWGHAIACVNLDEDPEDEMVIGIRDNRSDVHRCGVRVYDSRLDSASGTVDWRRQIVDAGAVAVEDLITADFDGDGRQDIIAVGRATHNAKLYFNR